MSLLLCFPASLKPWQLVVCALDILQYIELKHIVYPHRTHRKKQKNMFLHLPNFDLKNDMSWHAKRSKLWNILDSLHFNPQTGLARYNEIFDRDAFVYDRTRTWQQLRISFFRTRNIPHWFAIYAAELARNPFDSGRLTNCWTFWCQPRWPSARGLLLCHTMLSQPMVASHKIPVCYKCRNAPYTCLL